MDTDTVKKVRPPGKKPDARVAALSRALRGELKVPLVVVAEAVNLDWTSVGNFETCASNLSAKSERRILMFYAEAFAAKGIAVEPIPEGITLPELRLLLARVLHAAQLSRVIRHTGGAGVASAAAELGEKDFFDKVINTSLDIAGGRADSVGVNLRLRKRIEEEDAKAAGTR